MTYETEHEARCDLAAAHRMAVMDGLNEGTWNPLQLDVTARARADAHFAG